MNLDINTLVALINAFAGSQEEEEPFDYMKLLETVTNLITKLIELLKTFQAM